jgi:hypothetical protein
MLKQHTSLLGRLGALKNERFIITVTIFTKRELPIDGKKHLVASPQEFTGDNCNDDTGSNELWSHLNARLPESTTCCILFVEAITFKALQIIGEGCNITSAQLRRAYRDAKRGNYSPPRFTPTSTWMLIELQSFWEEINVDDDSVGSQFRRTHILYSKQPRSQGEGRHIDVWYFIVIFDTARKSHSPENTLKFNYLSPILSNSSPTSHDETLPIPLDSGPKEMSPYTLSPKLFNFHELIRDISDRVVNSDFSLPYTLAADLLSSLGIVDHSGIGDVREWVRILFRIRWLIC